MPAQVIPVNADEMARKSILLELKTLHESSHPAIVSFYGAFYREGRLSNSSLTTHQIPARRGTPTPLIALPLSPPDLDAPHAHQPALFSTSHLRVSPLQAPCT